jgi:hypothetical protein
MSLRQAAGQVLVVGLEGTQLSAVESACSRQRSGSIIPCSAVSMSKEAP